METYDTTCKIGCEKDGCIRSDYICAKSALNDISYTDGVKNYTLKNMCPTIVSLPYTTWESQQIKSLENKRKYFAKMLDSNFAWSKTQLLPKFYTSNAKTSTINAINKVWDEHCKASDVQKAHCSTYFPKCLNDKADNSDCLQYCASMMQCVDEVEAACNAANPAVCNAFSSFGPRSGSEDCKKLCTKFQNRRDSVNWDKRLTVVYVIATVASVLVLCATAIVIWACVCPDCKCIKKK